jgi:hypothetical protein
VTHDTSEHMEAWPPVSLLSITELAFSIFIYLMDTTELSGGRKVWFIDHVNKTVKTVEFKVTCSSLCWDIRILLVLEIKMMACSWFPLSYWFETVPFELHLAVIYPSFSANSYYSIHPSFSQDKEKTSGWH